MPFRQAVQVSSSKLENHWLVNTNSHPKPAKLTLAQSLRIAVFKSHEQDASVFLAVQVTHMKRASWVKKLLHHLNSCSPSAGFANKLISQGLGLAQGKQTQKGRKCSQWVSKSRREWSWMLARLGFLKKTPSRIQHSKQERHRWKKPHTYTPMHKCAHEHTHTGTYLENKNSSGIIKTFKWAQVDSRKV